MGSAATFTCRARGHVFWSINGQQVGSQASVDRFQANNVSVPLSTSSESSVVIRPVSVNHNGTTLQCLVEELGRLDILNRSKIVELFVIGM